MGHIRRVLEASPFHGEGYRKVWAKLRVRGDSDLAGAGAPIKLMRAHDLQAPHRLNEQWMLEKYAYRSPAQVRRDLVGLDAAA